ncbi:MAG: RING finger protein [Gammaproteobacteria bacterium]
MIGNNDFVTSTNLPGSPPNSPSSPAVTQRSQEVGDCPICLDALDEENGRLASVEPCDHTYHVPCIGQHINKIDSDIRCPMCRGSISLRKRLSIVKALKEEVDQPTVEPNNVDSNGVEPNASTVNWRRSVTGYIRRSFLRSLLSTGLGTLGGGILSDDRRLGTNPLSIALASFLGSGITSWLPEFLNRSEMDLIQFALRYASVTANPVLGNLLMNQIDARHLTTAAAAGAVGSLFGVLVNIPVAFSIEEASSSNNTGNEADRVDGFYRGVEEGLSLWEKADRDRSPSISDTERNELIRKVKSENSYKEQSHAYTDKFLIGFRKGLEDGYKEAVSANEAMPATSPSEVVRLQQA